MSTLRIASRIVAANYSHYGKRLDKLWEGLSWEQAVAWFSQWPVELVPEGLRGRFPLDFGIMASFVVSTKYLEHGNFERKIVVDSIVVVDRPVFATDSDAS